MGRLECSCSAASRSLQQLLWQLPRPLTGMRMWSDDSRTEPAPCGIRLSRLDLCCPVSACSYKESGSGPGRTVELSVPVLVVARPGPISTDSATYTRTGKRCVALRPAEGPALLLDTEAAKCSLVLAGHASFFRFSWKGMI